MFRLLITRFSAIGDVAMTVPVVHSLASQHPEMRITMLTKKGMKPFFDWMPANVEVIGVDVNKYDGVVGLEKLFNELKKRKFDAMADLHDVLRTKYLRSRFKLCGVKTAKIDKGREDKKELMGKGMSNEALIPMTERYVQVLNKLGIEVTLNYDRAFDPRDEDYAPVFNR
ncbi:MAG: glycosyl transferase family 1, partial [Bacteroidaceae bacterium]|nr:glycosyl transferase family 1 [Bacteroidaceae bacterium]